MKYKLLIISLFIGLYGYSQIPLADKIDSSNYYNYIKKEGNTNWLRISDAVPIIIDEMKKAGYSYAFIGVGDLIRINDSTLLVLTVSYQKDKKFGFVFESSHGFPLNKRDRNFLSNRKEANYLQSYDDIRGGGDFMGVEALPDNIFLLKESCYWYQYDEKATKFPVSKDIAINILRQDIQAYLELANKFKN